MNAHDAVYTEKEIRLGIAHAQAICTKICLLVSFTLHLRHGVRGWTGRVTLLGCLCEMEAVSTIS